MLGFASLAIDYPRGWPIYRLARKTMTTQEFSFFADPNCDLADRILAADYETRPVFELRIEAVARGILTAIDAVTMRKAEIAAVLEDHDAA